LKEDKDIDGRMTLKRILQEQGKSLQTGFKWLRIKEQWGGSCAKTNELSCSIKSRDFQE
jgi:hypothetical protein